MCVCVCVCVHILKYNVVLSGFSPPHGLLPEAVCVVPGSRPPVSGAVEHADQDWAAAGAGTIIIIINNNVWFYYEESCIT